MFQRDSGYIAPLLIATAAFVFVVWQGCNPAHAQTGLCRTPTGPTDTPLVACIGDSNCAPEWMDGGTSWCERVPYQTVNCAQASAVIEDGYDQLADIEATGGADRIIIALGSNNLLRGFTPQATAALLLQLAEQAETVAPTWVALIPPYDEDNGRTLDTSQLIQNQWDHTVDFHTGFRPFLYPGGIHINPEGQDLRAERAAHVPEPSPTLTAMIGTATLMALRRIRQ